MAIAAGFEPITAAVSGAASLPKLHLHRPSTPPTISFRTALIFSPISSRSPRRRAPAMPLFSGGGGGGINGMGNSGGGSGGDDAVGGGGGGGHDDKNNKKAAVLVLAERGRSLESVPKDLAAEIESGKIPAAILERYLELEKSAVFRWLLQFGGFRERLLADDLFLAKVAMECGVGIFTKTAAEYERRRENFSKELDVVIADIVMAITADFMHVWLPASTVSPRPPPAVSAGAIAKFFHSCPENAFQVALAGTSFSFLKRIGAIVCNGSKLFAVGTTSSLVGTLVANAIINARKAADSSSAGEVEDVPVSSTSVAYVVLMASSNLRYQGLAGVVEQRILEPMLQKLLLSALCFAVRTGKTFLGSLLWVDYAFRRIMSGIRSIFYVWLWVLGYN